MSFQTLANNRPTSSNLVDKNLAILKEHNEDEYKAFKAVLADRDYTGLEISNALKHLRFAHPEYGLHSVAARTIQTYRQVKLDES